MATSGWQILQSDGVAVLAYVPAQPYSQLVIYLADRAGDDLQSPDLRNIIETSQLFWLVPLHSEATYWSGELNPKFHAELSPAAWLTRLPGNMTPAFQTASIIGQGLGGQIALRLALQKPTTFPQVYARNPAIDFYRDFATSTAMQAEYPSQAAARQDSARYAVVGRGPGLMQVEYAVDSEERFEIESFLEKLRANGMAVEVTTQPGEAMKSDWKPLTAFLAKVRQAGQKRSLM
jgi:pimeloyl-ACP methyl ester carboxylesterase